jgi:hypothetical protein
MPFTLCAFHESTTGAVTTYAIKALSDPHVRVSDVDLWVPEALPMLAAVWAGGNSVTLARLESPTLRTLTPIDLIPFELATEPGSPPNLIYQGHAPKLIGGGEALNAKFTSTGADILKALVWLCDAALAQVTGEIFTVKASTSVTLSANQWTNAAITFAQTLPRGRYQVVGMRAKSAGLVAARLVFPGYAWRPGCLGCDAYNDVERPEFRHGRMGVWGEFDHDVPPTVDFLSISADSNPEVWLDLIKIA